MNLRMRGAADLWGVPMCLAGDRPGSLSALSFSYQANIDARCRRSVGRKHYSRLP